ncbi:MAG: SGNH/GDSL hydrolase family protein [Acidimicrobiia bacterium]
MRRFLVLATVLAMTLVPLTAKAETDENPIQLGLGDSVAWGFGASDSFTLGYVSLVNKRAPDLYCVGGSSDCAPVELVNLAVPGATSSSLIAGQLQPALELLTERNSDDNPGNDVVLVTVTIGGNDLFNPVIAACAGGVTAECTEVISNGFATYTANLSQILGSLRAAAGPGTEIAMMTYYNPLGACFLADLAPLADLVLEGGGPLPFGLNDIIRGVAAATGVTIVETYGELRRDDFVGGQDCLHPDDSGYKRIARLFTTTLR